MSNQVALLLVAGLIAAVLLALLMNRRLKAWWGDKGVQTGLDDPVAQALKGQNMTATGKGSSIKKAQQIRNQTFEGEQTMRAESGGKLENVKQHTGTGSKGNQE
jgi:hypothetical protein